MLVCIGEVHMTSMWSPCGIHEQPTVAKLFLIQVIQVPQGATRCHKVQTKAIAADMIERKTCSTR